jgi:hypothetical protein
MSVHFCAPTLPEGPEAVCHVPSGQVALTASLRGDLSFEDERPDAAAGTVGRRDVEVVRQWHHRVAGVAAPWLAWHTRASLVEVW